MTKFNFFKINNFNLISNEKIQKKKIFLEEDNIKLEFWTQKFGDCHSVHSKERTAAGRENQ